MAPAISIDTIDQIMPLIFTIARRFRRSARGVFLLLVLMTAGYGVAYAQETIRPAEGAQLLRRIWMTRGSVLPGNEQIGFGTAGLGDINGDSIGDFTVRWGYDGRWRVYYGASPEPGTTPAWISEPSTWLPPVVGDFWGTGQKGVGFPTAVWGDSGHNYTFFRVPIYRIEHDSLPLSPAVTVGRDTLFLEHSVLAEDMDGDGADDLIVSGALESGVIQHLIYRGGKSFDAGKPTHIVQDSGRSNVDRRRYTVIGDFDGDHRLDIVTGGTYAVGQQLKFWFSSLHESVWQWQQPDRVVTLADSLYPTIDAGITAVDCDGDRVLDIILPARNGRICVYRSGATAGSSLVRSFSIDDADVRWTGGFTRPRPIGYLNDSTGRYGMFGLQGGDGKGHGILAIFSGGPTGPDAAYDGFHGPTYDDLYPDLSYAECAVMTDVSGDGWPDVLVGDWKYYDETLHPGIALVLAGGPYIPRDSAMLGVRDVRIGDRRDALSIWPMPAREELHIAWRGDLPRMPERFVVHDVLGGMVAEGSAEPWRGSVIWRCRDVTSGIYLLTILDRDGVPIATARVLKD